jgi:transcriptional regulator with XRE-family HTH domain
MPKFTASRLTLPLPVEDSLKRVGQNIRQARLRRRISVRSMAERMMVSPTTVLRLEGGDPSISLAILLSALWILQLHHRFGEIAAPNSDAVGQSLDTERLPKRIRSQKR